MGSFIRIDSLWIDFTEYFDKDGNPREPSSTNVDESKPDDDNHKKDVVNTETQQDSIKEIIPAIRDINLNDVIELSSDSDHMQISDDNENNYEFVRRTGENNANHRASSVPSPLDCQGHIPEGHTNKKGCEGNEVSNIKLDGISKEFPTTEIEEDDEDEKPKKYRSLAEIIKQLDPFDASCTSNTRIVRKCRTPKGKKSRGKKTKSNKGVPKANINKGPKNNKPQIERTSDVIITRNTPIARGIVISEPTENEMGGVNKNVSNNNECDILHKGKEKMIETNEDSDSSSSWVNEEIFVFKAQRFRNPPHFGEGTSKLFEENTSRSQLNIGEGMEQNSLQDVHTPPIQGNNVPTKEKEGEGLTGDVYDMIMHEVADILKNKLPNVGINQNGLLGNTPQNVTFRATGGEDVKVKNWNARKSRSKKKRNPKGGKNEKK
uniref:Uncharacterized protein LOC105851991 n=1 Tax=Cicer arietinum TaxID=3827 RepID=A0A3Q7X6P7_CICAR|nr:uncharacterized protein LOC105851991 [Cicer arietinum]